jgi:hypothetical protein
MTDAAPLIADNAKPGDISQQSPVEDRPHTLPKDVMVSENTDVASKSLKMSQLSSSRSQSAADGRSRSCSSRPSPNLAAKMDEGRRRSAGQVDKEAARLPPKLRSEIEDDLLTEVEPARMSRRFSERNTGQRNTCDGPRRSSGRYTGRYTSDQLETATFKRINGRTSVDRASLARHTYSGPEDKKHTPRHASDGANGSDDADDALVAGSRSLLNQKRKNKEGKTPACLSLEQEDVFMVPFEPTNPKSSFSRNRAEASSSGMGRQLSTGSNFGGARQVSTGSNFGGGRQVSGKRRSNWTYDEEMEREFGSFGGISRQVTTDSCFGGFSRQQSEAEPEFARQKSERDQSSTSAHSADPLSGEVSLPRMGSIDEDSKMMPGSSPASRVGSKVEDSKSIEASPAHGAAALLVATPADVKEALQVLIKKAPPDEKEEDATKGAKQTLAREASANQETPPLTPRDVILGAGNFQEAQSPPMTQSPRTPSIDLEAAEPCKRRVSFKADLLDHGSPLMSTVSTAASEKALADEELSSNLSSKASQV